MSRDTQVKHLLEWHRETINGIEAGERVERPINIVLRSASGQEIREWKLRRCWPAAYEVVNLKPRPRGAPLYEEFTFSCLYVEEIDVP